MVDPAELAPGDTIVRTKEQYGSGGGSQEISRTVTEITEAGVRVRGPEDTAAQSTLLSPTQVRNTWELETER